MYGRTTMKPADIAARANAHAAYGGNVDADAVAKAQADAVAQSLRDGFLSRDQIATNGLTATAPCDSAAAVRQDLEAMTMDPNSAALTDLERGAMEGMIAEAERIEAAARFEGAKGLADSEYELAIQIQERQALEVMIAEGQKAGCACRHTETRIHPPYTHPRLQALCTSPCFQA